MLRQRALEASHEQKYENQGRKSHCPYLIVKLMISNLICSFFIQIKSIKKFNETKRTKYENF